VQPVPSTPYLLVVRLVAVVVATAAGIFLLVGGDREATSAKDETRGLTSVQGLVRYAESKESDVYWAGNIGARRLELTASATATFVRYLPESAGTTSSRSSLTVATYPLDEAYATAINRSRGEGVTSRRLAGEGIAVWNVEQPTSVYLAWRGTPSLVEIYAPTAAEARSVALSGHVRPVR
jgi:hypothetical protein